MHWCHNVFVILIVTTKPGWNNEIALFTSVDPVLSAGGSYLFNLEGYIWLAMHMAVFVALTAWRQSPFYIAPVAALPEPAAPQGALPEEDVLPDAAARSDLAPAPTQA
jgi:hypothetical protein